MFQVLLNGEIIYQPLDDELTIFNPKLTLEMGKAGCLEFDIPQTNAHYGELTQLSAMINVNMDTEEVFRGRVLSNERQFNNLRHIYCEGDLAFLVDSVQKTEKYTGKTRALFNKFIAAHNARVEDYKKFTVGEVTIDDRPIKLEGHVEDMNTGNIDYKQIAINSIVGEWNDTFTEIKTCLIDYCGGYLRTRYQNGVRYIDYVKEYGGTSDQDITLGTNMLDLTEEISAEDLFTVLVPLGDDNLTIASVNRGSDELVDTVAVAKYGRIVRTHVFNNVNEPATLLENAQRYLATNVNVPRTVTITAIDLHFLNKSEGAIHIGDRVHIRSEAHEMDEDLMCTKIEYDLANPVNNKYTFGNPKQSLTERYKEDQRKQNDAYGNSASGGHGGGGSGGGAAEAAAEAAGAVAEEVKKEEDERSRYFYDTYIDLDAEDDGKITLGAMLRYGRTYKNVLLTDVGIDLDASQGNLNMWALKGSIDENHSLIEGQEARIDVFQSDMDVALRLMTNRIETVDGTQEQHYTEMKQLSSQNAASIDLVAGYLSDETDRAKASEASINLRVDHNASSITLKADQIDLDAALTRIATLESDTIFANRVVSAIANASLITASYIQATNLNGTSTITSPLIYMGGELVTTRTHYHTLSAAGGVVTMGSSTTDGPTSFNIADTQFYKDGVSAAKESVRVNDIRKNPDQSASIGTSTLTIYYPVQANTTEYSTYHHNTVLNVPAGDFFESVTVRLRGAGKTRWDNGGSSSGTNVGSSVDTTYLYVSWDGVNFSKWNPSQGVYYGGSGYTHYLRGSSETVYNDGGSETYYKLK